MNSIDKRHMQLVTRHIPVWIVTPTRISASCGLRLRTFEQLLKDGPVLGKR